MTERLRIFIHISNYLQMKIMGKTLSDKEGLLSTDSGLAHHISECIEHPMYETVWYQLPAVVYGTPCYRTCLPRYPTVYGTSRLFYGPSRYPTKSSMTFFRTERIPYKGATSMCSYIRVIHWETAKLFSSLLYARGDKNNTTTQNIQ